MTHKDEIRNLIRINHRRLQILREQQALQGINTPPEIRLEIEDIEAKLEELQTELERTEDEVVSTLEPYDLDYLQEQLALYEAAQQHAANPRRFQAKIEEFRDAIANWDRRVETQHQRIADGLAEIRRQTVEERQQIRVQKRLKVVGRRPLGAVEHFKNRMRERETIGRLLAEPTTRLVSVIGHGGMGKTALASKVLQDLERHRWPHTEDDIPLDGIVYLSTRTAGISLERLYLDCAKMLGGESEERFNTIWTNAELTTEGKISKLIEALRDGLYVILLDNMEEVLDESGQLVDKDLQLFFDRSLVAVHGARLLVTSRQSLVFRREVMRFDHQVKLLEGLPMSEGVALLRELDPNGDYGLQEAPEEQLMQVVSLTYGVPRALEVVAGILANDPFASLDDVIEQFYEQPDVVQALIEENFKRLDKNARKVVEALAVFRRPVPPVAVDYLLKPFAPGIDVPTIVRRLARANIVSVDRVAKTVTLHPIDQDYAYSQLPEDGARELAYTRQALERRAADYYAQLGMPPETWHSIDNLEPQLAEFEHRVQAGDYNGAHKVLEPIDSDYLFLWGHYTRLVEMREKLIGQLTIAGMQLANLNRLGRAYHMLGQVNRAIEYYEEALSLARELGDRQEEGLQLSFMGIAYHDLGNFKRALEFHEQALEIDRELGRRQMEGVDLGRLGLIYHTLRLFERAIEFYQQALAIAREVGDRRNEGIWLGNLGRTYRNLGQIEQTISYSQQALDIALELGDRREEGFWYDRLGLGYRLLGRIERAVEFHEQALSIAREIGDRRREGAGFSNLGDAYYAQGEFQEAIQAYEQALTIAREIGDYRGEAIRLGRLGNAYQAVDQVEQSIELLEHALIIARDIDDPREESYQLWRLGKALLATGALSEAGMHCTDAVALDIPETSYLAAVTLGIIRLLQHDETAREAFEDAADRCRTMLNKTSGLYEPRYALATALIGSAGCDPRWAIEGERDRLLAMPLAEYRQALEMCAAQGVVKGTRRNLELIRAAGIEGLESVFELLEAG
jgi:tetratricopeptide (TPR) repeat protein